MLAEMAAMPLGQRSSRVAASEPAPGRAGMIASGRSSGEAVVPAAAGLATPSAEAIAGRTLATWRKRSSALARNVQ